jgi:hypothetical protein
MIIEIEIQINWSNKIKEKQIIQGYTYLKDYPKIK